MIIIDVYKTSVFIDRMKKKGKSKTLFVTVNNFQVDIIFFLKRIELVL